MSLLNKIIYLGCLSIVAINVHAGGDESLLSSIEASKNTFQPYLYTELGFGYASTGYGNFYDSSSWNDTSKINGGLAYQGDVGFSFMPHLSVELGLGMLPKAEYNTYDNDQQADVSASYKSWYGYFQGRVDASLKGVVNIFAKAGVAYRSIDYSYNGNLDGAGLDDYYWGPIFGGGLLIPLKNEFYAMIEYSHLTGSSDSNQGQDYPDSDLYLAKLGYRFMF